MYILYQAVFLQYFFPIHTKVDLQIVQCVRGVCALQSSSYSYIHHTHSGTGELYEDDGKTTQYMNGRYVNTTFSYVNM